jgi:regulator-associated protein of mTOR
MSSTSAPTGHSTKQRLVIQGFSEPATPKTLSSIAIPLVPTYHVPSRPFLPSASSLVFHPVEMVVAASGFDSSGQVKLFRCPLPERSEVGEGAGMSGFVNGH